MSGPFFTPISSQIAAHNFGENSRIGNDRDGKRNASGFSQVLESCGS
jgi:hypothetical protein